MARQSETAEVSTHHNSAADTDTGAGDALGRLLATGSGQTRWPRLASPQLVWPAAWKAERRAHASRTARPCLICPLLPLLPFSASCPALSPSRSAHPTSSHSALCVPCSVRPGRAAQAIWAGAERFDHAGRCPSLTPSPSAASPAMLCLRSLASKCHNSRAQRGYCCVWLSTTGILACGMAVYCAAPLWSSEAASAHPGDGSA